MTLDIGGEQIELDNEDIEVRLQAKPGWAAAQGQTCVVVLATELTPELVAEGLARDFVRLVQDRRKDLGLEFTDRIEDRRRRRFAELQKAIEPTATSSAAKRWLQSLVFDAAGGRRRK